MAQAQNQYRRCLCLWVKSTPAIYASTTDLPEDAAVTALGAFYTKRIVNMDATLTQSLPGLFYGMPNASAVEFTLDNSDGALSASAEWRAVPVVLYHYDRDTTAKTTELAGVITRARFVGNRVTLSIGSYLGHVLDELLPAAVIDPASGSPFEFTGSPGTPIPVVFGEGVPVQLPNVLVADAAETAHAVVSDPPGDDFVVAHGAVYVRQVYSDIDNQLPGLERLGSFAAAPGSPAYVNTTTFSVTGDQRVRYEVAAPIRFKTTASAGAYVFSEVASYDAATNRVTIAHPLLDSGLSGVELGGDYLINRGYQDVTDGLQPVPAAPGADFTAVRLFGAGEGRPIAVADNPAYPTATTQIGAVIQAILTDTTWGLSTRSAQAVNATSFSTANLALASAGLTGAVCGALAYNLEQRQARNVLAELLMMRGMRLYQNDSLEWLLSVDTAPSSPTKTFQLDTGYQAGIPIKRVLDHGKVDAEEAVSSLTLYWDANGRAVDANSRFSAAAFSRLSTKTVSGIGTALTLYNPWIRDQTIAELVTHYIAEKLKGADERLQFTAGQEARDVTLGEVITASVPTDGITGDWQVYSIAKTLSDVTLTCIRANATAYGSVSGVTTSNAPAETDVRTQTGPSTNLIANPDFGGPYWTIAGTLNPHRWALNALDVTVEIDYSAAVLPDLLGGHYVRCTTVSNSTPAVASSFTISTLDQPCPATTTLLGSFYCDATDGVFAYVSFTGTASTSQLATLVRDPTDTNGLGWARYYFRVRAPSTAQRVAMGIGFSKAGTYQIEAVQLEAVTRTTRKPSTWRRHKPQPLTQTASAELTFNGASTYTATNLIPAGARVIGVVSRVTQAITLGTATSYSIGTSTDPGAWGEGVTNTALNATTGASNFTAINTINFPTTTSVVVTGNGTITGGTLRLTVEYTRPAPASAA